MLWSWEGATSSEVSVGSVLGNRAPDLERFGPYWDGPYWDFPYYFGGKVIGKVEKSQGETAKSQGINGESNRDSYDFSRDLYDLSRVSYEKC